MQENKRVLVAESLLVGAGKSSRLAAIRAKVKANDNQQVAVEKEKRKWVTGLEAETKIALEQAGILIEDKLSVIFDAYPQGKKNTFFKLKYGIKADQVNKLPRKRVFNLLNLEAGQVKQFRLIESIDSKGQLVDND